MLPAKTLVVGLQENTLLLPSKVLEIAAVLAGSFARIFFRNAINLGLLIIESPEAAREAEEGDISEIDINQGVIRNVTKNKEYKIKPLPENLQAILKAGGLMEYAKEKIKNAS